MVHSRTLDLEVNSSRHRETCDWDTPEFDAACFGVNGLQLDCLGVSDGTGSLVTLLVINGVFKAD